MPDNLGQTIIPANGVGLITIAHHLSPMVWQVEQIGVTVGPNSTGGNIAIYKNGNLVSPTSVLVPQISITGSPSVGQTAAGLPYVYIGGSDILQIIVNAVTPGDSLSYRAQYVEYMLSDPEVHGR